MSLLIIGKYIIVIQCHLESYIQRDVSTGCLINSSFESPLYKACTADYDEYNYPEYNSNFIDINAPINNNHMHYNEINNDIKYKFNRLYEQKVINVVVGDSITNFENAIRETFGNDYKLITDYKYDIEAQYPEKRIQMIIENGITKDFTKKMEWRFRFINKNMWITIKYDYKMGWYD